jgi:hypothetical protein
LSGKIPYKSIDRELLAVARVVRRTLEEKG